MLYLPGRSAGWSFFGLIRLRLITKICMKFLPGIQKAFCFFIHIHSIFFLSLSGTKTVACKDTTTPPYATVRHNQCELLLSLNESVSRCHQCTRYRNTLRAIASRKRSQDGAHRTDLSSHVSICYFTDGEKDKWLKKQHSELKRRNCSAVG